MWRAALVAGAFLGPAALPAQGDFVSARPQAELRALGTLSPRWGAGVGVGANVPAGYYVRVGPVASAVRDVDGGATTIGAGVMARFLLDPFAESRWGVYAGGGLGVLWRPGEPGRAVLTAQAGVAVPGGRAWERAIEVETGGGIRVGIAFRPRRARGR